ncbi:hypothetical protein J8281_10515 [Aquimarina sp. U1-2]|uniref:hypothetical protein n=1 Tax=Aquimarina sp. U1-2 TaxID=2823141 RepID=UPI001AEC79AE|nr:hypothetical protein [Aquimarina sp. U1-2]MBP2832617.1 hypothetical protein [Aquimarina sp. U1-2]
MTLEEFYEAIEDLSQIYENKDLEEFLLALYDRVEAYKKEKLTFDLVLKMINESFTGKPINFQNDWLQCTKPPDSNRMSKKFSNPGINYAFDQENTSSLQPYEFTLAVLRFQIAELHKMKENQLKNELRYFGVDSETGHRWYNFDPFANLECGVRCMIDNEERFGSLDWSFIGELLENGRIYE